MRVIIITDANTNEINEKCEYLERNGYTIIDVVLQQNTFCKNYRFNAIIKYKKITMEIK